MDRGAWQGYSPWGRTESDITERLGTLLSWWACSLSLNHLGNPFRRLSQNPHSIQEYDSTPRLKAQE